jgi:hypothetical protein
VKQKKCAEERRILNYGKEMVLSICRFYLPVLLDISCCRENEHPVPSYPETVLNGEYRMAILYYGKFSLPVHHVCFRNNTPDP